MFTPSQRVFTLSILFSSIVFASFSQTRIYYDELFKLPVQKKTKYFREFVDTDSGTFVREMCSDTLMASGMIRPSTDLMQMNDFAHFVKSFGNPYQNKKEFAAMRADIDYYDRGVRVRKFVARMGKVRHAQLWSKQGEPLLEAGNGSYNYAHGGEALRQTFQDSVMTEMFGVRVQEGDTVYYTYDQIAEPHGGYSTFMEDLVRILKYPGFARLSGKQGVVYVQFIVDKTGKLTEFKPLTSEAFNLEKRAVDRLSKMPNWKPAVFRGRPVKMKFTVPIKFRLT